MTGVQWFKSFQGDCRSYNYACVVSSDNEPNWDSLFFMARIIPRICHNINRYVQIRIFPQHNWDENLHASRDFVEGCMLFFQNELISKCNRNTHLRSFSTPFHICDIIYDMRKLSHKNIICCMFRFERKVPGVNDLSDSCLWLLVPQSGNLDFLGKLDNLYTGDLFAPIEPFALITQRIWHLKRTIFFGLINFGVSV